MRRPTHRPPLTVLAATATATALFLASPVIAGADHIRAQGDLVRYSSAVPEGARAQVAAVYTAAGDSNVTLQVWGMAPNTEYGAHAHVNACDTTGADARSRFQNMSAPDAAAAATPQFANRTNEIWLDLTTDAEGNGVAETTVPWQFSPARRATSVIMHVEHTHLGPTNSGVAGARLSCLTVGF